jgi:DMSO reductase anchor subunit
MHPAPSIIFFTVFSGLGFGMLAFLGFGKPDVSGFTGFIFFFIAFALAVGGLISSTFHLGNPQRAIKAFSQWRSSWLSREGCLAVATLAVMGLYAALIIFLNTRIAALGLLGAALSLMTVFATSMIYTQMKTVPRWNHWTVPLLFMVYALTGGAFLTGQVQIAAAGLMTLGALQIAYWVLGDARFSKEGSTLESATGLGEIGKVRMFEAPHTSENYLMKEMVHQVGRKHAIKLRIIGLVLVSVLPWAILMFIGFSHLMALVALTAHILGALATRWLFFAEAEHTVGLYYGQRG